MKPTGYLGLDVGGTGAKAGVVDARGRLLGFARSPYSPLVTEDGHVEIPIDAVYAGARDAARMAIGESGAHVVALAVSSQGQTFVSLDGNDQPLHHAIVWYDGRASEQAGRLREAINATCPPQQAPTVHAIDSAPKIMWLRDHHPALMERAQRYLLLPDYLAYRLTGSAGTDPATASSTGLYRQDAADYCPQALSAAGIGKGALAEIRKPGEPIAPVLPESANDWNLNAGVLMVTGTNDQYAGALGAGNCRMGILSATTGTCLALVTLTEKLPDPMPAGLFGGRFPIPRFQYALAYAKTAGVVLEWFNRQFCAGKSLRDLDELAAQVPIGSRGLMMVPHFDGMVSPRPDPRARGAFLNLSLHHSSADMYRATLEALGYTFKECLDLFRQSSFDIKSVRAIGGGAKSDLWVQMIADILGLPVERPVVAEAAVLGAAMIAAVGSGEFASLEQSSEAFHQSGQTFSPRPENHAVYRELGEKYVRLCQHLYSRPV